MHKIEPVQIVVGKLLSKHYKYEPKGKTIEGECCWCKQNHKKLYNDLPQQITQVSDIGLHNDNDNDKY